jgi:hypothetical protein
MNQIQPANETSLIQQGLASYWDARYAMRVFEERITDTAVRVLKANLAGIGEACGTPKPPEENEVLPHGPESNYLGQVAIGAHYCGWGNGVRFGVGWRLVANSEAVSPIACLAFRVSTHSKKLAIIGRLKKLSLTTPNHQVHVSESREGEHEVAVWSVLSPNDGLAEITALLGAVLDCAVEWCKEAGGLQKLIS